MSICSIFFASACESDTGMRWSAFPVHSGKLWANYNSSYCLGSIPWFNKYALHTIPLTTLPVSLLELRKLTPLSKVTQLWIPQVCKSYSAHALNQSTTTQCTGVDTQTTNLRHLSCHFNPGSSGRDLPALFFSEIWAIPSQKPWSLPLKDAPAAPWSLPSRASDSWGFY